VFDKVVSMTVLEVKNEMWYKLKGKLSKRRMMRKDEGVQVHVWFGKTCWN
jgi:hypothetical protein